VIHPSKKFLITGLPRSRTAWWAALTSTVEGVMCFHEPCSVSPSWEQSLDVWATSGYNQIGIADSSLGFHLQEILLVHKPRTLVIRRSLSDVEQSLKDINIRTPGYCKILSDRILRCYGHELVKFVDYERLNSYEVVKECLLWLLPWTTIDLVKVRQFMDFNVQISMDSLDRKLRNCKANIEDLLGADVVRELELWKTSNT
jgi:hypothetical protein